jgi:signal recognition particle receptor subunit beta
MIFQGAVIKEQGVTFAVVVVKSHILNSRTEADRVIAAFQAVFPDIPVVLMAQDYRGVPTYYGREDISKYMANVPIAAIPWEEYSVNI